MNKEILKGDWNIIKGKVKEQWGKLTDDDLSEIRGRREQLLGRLQKRYGYDKERAETEISGWEQACTSCAHDHDRSNSERDNHSHDAHHHGRGEREHAKHHHQ